MYVSRITDLFLEGTIVTPDTRGDVGCNDGFLQANATVLLDEWDEGVGNVITHPVVSFRGEM